MTVHLVKMCVGVRDVAHLTEIQSRRLARAHGCGEAPVLRHFTRNRPRRWAELTDGGSLYWVMKGFIRVRQEIVDVEAMVDTEGRPSCALVMDPQLVRVELKAFRAFQGWRYLAAGEAPADVNFSADRGAGVPPGMAAALRELGLL